MMNQFKTSTQIALKFAISMAIIFLGLGIIINIVFFSQWIRNEGQRIIMPGHQTQQNTPRGIRRLIIPNRIMKIPYDDTISNEIQQNLIFRNITSIGDDYLLYRYEGNQIHLIDISRQIQMQYQLLWITFVITIGGAMITFALSRRFAKNSLYKILELADYTSTLDIHNLDTKVPISGPLDDEIRIIAQSLQNALDTIKTQTDSLKDFISYASHELKTPLSTIRSLIDLGDKTKSHHTANPKIKKTLTEMTNLLETLLLITKREFHTIKKEHIDLIPLVAHIGADIQQQYQDKHIRYTTELPQQYEILGHHEIITIIISNLLNNAYKFTPDHGNIILTLADNIITITDNGIGISPSDQDKIRTRFRKKSTDNNTGYGLGLYMVKLLIEKLGRSITVDSTEQIGTTFTITMT